MDTRTARLALTILFCLLAIFPALAGEYFERDGVAIGGYDPVAYFTEMKPVKGSSSFHAEYLGSKFHFASAAHRETFAANPAKYAPQYGGFCAYGMAKGYKASIDPAAFTVVGDKLFLNYNGTVRALWVLDIPGYVRKADQNWPEVRKTASVTQ